MAEERVLDVGKDFEYLTAFLPAGWAAKAKELGALRRCRKVPDAETLLRVLLIHLAEGCSLRETAARAQEGGIIELSDVAIMDRLRVSGEWFRWINTEVMRCWVRQQPHTVFGEKWNIRLVDATRVKEPGPTGSSWCIHYSITLPGLACDQLFVTGADGSGESLRRFGVKAGDLFIADAVYGVRPSIEHVCEGGGDVVVRFASSNLPLQTEKGTPFPLLRRLRTLTGRQVGDWPVLLSCKGQEVSGRVCAIRKSRQAAEKARRHAVRAAQKAGAEVKPQTLEAAEYIFVFTSVKGEDLTKANVLEMYRGRWQIELVFKRLKSIISLGHLRKVDEESAKAWIHGKLLVAFLVEALIRHGESFSPWGYPLRETAGTDALSLA